MKADIVKPIQIDLSTLSRTELEEFAMKKSTRLMVVEAELETYKELLRKNQSNKFGSSSERYVSEGQISLFNEAEMEADPDAEEPKKSEVLPPTKQKKRKGHKKELVAHLPKEVIEYTLTDDKCVCPNCRDKVDVMKTIVRIEIEVIPAKYKVVEYRTNVYSCKNCDKNGTEGTIITAPSPKGMFRNSLASPSLVADIMFKKYALAFPLYRQEQELSRIGIFIKRNTMANWVIIGTNLYLMPIWSHMKGYLISADVIFADESPIQVLHEPGRAATANSYIWVYQTGSQEERQVVLFDYKPGRGAEYPEKFLDGYKGYIQCDGYKSYRTLANNVNGTGTGPPDIVIACCWSHARRKYTDIIKGLAKNMSIKGTATEKAIAFIGRLFEIEREAKNMSPAERQKYRGKHAKPVVDKYFEWLKSIKGSCTGSLLAAVNYSLNQEAGLRVYLTDGRLDISTNLCENSLRPYCIGRKNWLFSDTPEGASASAVCYSIIETAKANGLDAFEYLKYIFNVFKDSDIASLDMEDFMPWSQSLPDTCRLATKSEACAS